MNTGRHLRSVPVDQLCHGLYVAETDRPWTEIPLMFQGFTITSADEIDVLRAHCQHVFVDAARSIPAALRALDDTAGSGKPVEDTNDATATATGMRPETDTADAFDHRRQPDTRRFQQLLQRARESHSDTRRFLEDLFAEIDTGEMPSVHDGRSVVADLLQTVSRNTGAAIWLANLDAKDAPTSVHSVNVCVLALAFGAHLGLDQQELEHIGLGALLHDTGKLFLPAAIREKSDALTDAEWNIVRQHPQDGYDILVDKGDFPREVLDIVRCHHERLDGSGYPAGLAGVQVPLHVRVVALANAYESMTSHRVYRSAMSADRALQALYDDAASRFGSRLVQEFIRCMGIYPAGSLVELDNGAVGVVLGSRPDARIQPTVLLVRAPGGAYYRKRVVLNLAAEAEAETDSGAPARRIRRALDPADEEIDVAGIIAIEFGLDLSPG